MPKIELTLNVNYLPSWGAWEGVRELIQNARDAEIQFDAPMTIERTTSDYLVIENRGTTLPHEVLLLGTTSKADDTSTIGKFGEGLKLGVLALVRSGHEVRIQTGDENWTPYIERSERFKADVLKFDITKRRGDIETDIVRVKVGGVTKEIWATLKERFLFVAKLKDKDAIETSHGRLLLAGRFRGKIFVKGIFVQDRAESSYGYDFHDADIDRDRKMVASWDLRAKTSRIWREASVTRPDLLNIFLDLCEKKDPDVEHISYLSDMPQQVIDAAAARFTGRHGDKAIPVKNLAESKDIEHLGRHGVIVSESLSALLAKKLGDTYTIKKQLATEAERFYAWGELTEDERSNVKWAIDLLNDALDGDVVDAGKEDEPAFDFNKVDIVDFRSSGTLGQRKDGRYLIARGECRTGEDFLATLIHEVAHDKGGDGDHSHIAQLESLWTKVVRTLRRRGGR